MELTTCGKWVLPSRRSTHRAVGASSSTKGGENLQVNTYIVPPLSESGGVRQATAEEFRTDVVALLSKLDEASCRANLPIYLPPGADLTQMARTVRLLGRVRGLQMMMSLRPRKQA